MVDSSGSSGKDVFGFNTPKKTGSMAKKAKEELHRTPKSVTATPKTPKTSDKNRTPGKVRIYI